MPGRIALGAEYVDTPSRDSIRYGCYSNVKHVEEGVFLTRVEAHCAPKPSWRLEGTELSLCFSPSAWRLFCKALRRYAQGWEFFSIEPEGLPFSIDFGRRASEEAGIDMDCLLIEEDLDVDRE